MIHNRSLTLLGLTYRLYIYIYIYIWISNFLNKFNILNDNQYGFRKNLSTADALSDVLESVNTNLENLENCAIV